ncbi:hypothetical protein [Peptoniphilus sp.]|uniref:hypothetical protein n=1 Tax=Peptoniphilus sp. TaxID=1971214 RepID=UPI003993A4E9
MDLGRVFLEFMDRRWKILRELTQLFILITLVLSISVSPYFLVWSAITIGFYVKNFKNLHPKYIEEIIEREPFEDQKKENIRSVMEYYLLNMTINSLYSRSYNFIKYIGLFLLVGVVLYNTIF